MFAEPVLMVIAALSAGAAETVWNAPDVMIGGEGADILTGGSGNDSFVYTSLADAGDIIIDFDSGRDIFVFEEDSFGAARNANGQANLIVWKSLGDSQRRVLLGARLLGVSGVVQREGDVLHVIAHRLEDRSPLLGELEARSRDFR